MVPCCYNTLKLSLVWLWPPLHPPTTISCGFFAELRCQPAYSFETMVDYDLKELTDAGL